jgi:hypothetical protein
MKSVKYLGLFGLFALALAATGCSVATDDVAQGEDPLLRKTASTSSWSYRGPVPTLDAPRLTVSLAGHTVHVAGLLPRGHTAPLPFHAITEPDPAGSGRTMVHLVYPIATVAEGGRTEEGLPTRNPEPNDYVVCGGDNFHASNRIGEFGGFPFIEYVCNHRDADGRVRGGIAFHGPITSRTMEGSSYWYLKRGPVSHACNRMLGEHVLELAHAIGFDRGARRTPVKVIADFDTFRGKKIDVDHPATGWTRPPASESFVFPMWQAVKTRDDGTTALEFPQWACETSRCASMPPNAADPETGGLPRGEIACPADYHPEAVGRGVMCIGDDGANAWGPYTQAMVAGCRGGGGGRVCDSDRWAASFAKRLRGDGACPVGARFDAVTGYCAEGESAFGPFPADVVARCVRSGGGETTCRSARWNRFFLARLLGRL